MDDFENEKLNEELNGGEPEEQTKAFTEEAAPAADEPAREPEAASEFAQETAAPQEEPARPGKKSPYENAPYVRNPVHEGQGFHYEPQSRPPKAPRERRG